MKLVTFKEAMEYCKKYIIISDVQTDDALVVKLSNGATLTCRSVYDGPYSDVIPGNGISPPQFELKEPNA